MQNIRSRTPVSAVQPTAAGLRALEWRDRDDLACGHGMKERLVVGAAMCYAETIYHHRRNQQPDPRSSSCYVETTQSFVRQVPKWRLYMKRAIFTFTLALLLATPAIGQQMYKCPDVSGIVKFQQMPCSPTGGGETVTVKPTPSGAGSGLSDDAKASLIAPVLVLAGEDILVGDISTKKMSEVDNSGDVWFSIKALVKNTAQVDKKVDLVLQAVDSDGFELKSISLTGSIKAGGEEILTDKTYMPDKQYRGINKWKLVRIQAR